MALRKTGLDFRLQLLEQVTLFRGLPAQVRADLAGQTRERRVARRQCFFVAGDPASDVLVLCAGRVKLTQASANGQPNSPAL